MVNVWIENTQKSCHTKKTLIKYIDGELQVTAENGTKIKAKAEQKETPTQ
jgi:hypothetical protein